MLGGRGKNIPEGSLSRVQTVSSHQFCGPKTQTEFKVAPGDFLKKNDGNSSKLLNLSKTHHETKLNNLKMLANAHHQKETPLK